MQPNPPQIMAGVAVQSLPTAAPPSGSHHEIATARLNQPVTLAGGDGREENRPLQKNNGR